MNIKQFIVFVLCAVAVLSACGLSAEALAQQSELPSWLSDDVKAQVRESQEQGGFKGALERVKKFKSLRENLEEERWNVLEDYAENNSKVKELEAKILAVGKAYAKEVEQLNTLTGSSWEITFPRLPQTRACRHYRTRFLKTLVATC